MQSLADSNLNGIKVALAEVSNDSIPETSLSKSTHIDTFSTFPTHIINYSAGTGTRDKTQEADLLKEARRCNMIAARDLLTVKLLWLYTKEPRNDAELISLSDSILGSSATQTYLMPRMKSYKSVITFTGLIYYGPN